MLMHALIYTDILHGYIHRNIRGRSRVFIGVQYISAACKNGEVKNARLQCVVAPLDPLQDILHIWKTILLNAHDMMTTT